MDDTTLAGTDATTTTTMPADGQSSTAGATNQPTAPTAASTSSSANNNNNNTTTASTTPHTPFRRWGVQPVPTTAKATRTHHGIPTSATRIRPSASTTAGQQQEQQQSNTATVKKQHPNELTIDDIPDQVIARGIAARTNRTNGLLPFLGAVAPPRSVSLWLNHRPGLEACRIRLSSESVRMEAIRSTQQPCGE